MTEKAKQQTGDIQGKVKAANNSSMAQDFDEIKRLGKEMNVAKTGSELRQENLSSDPIQQKDAKEDETMQELIKSLADEFVAICSKLTEGIAIARDKDDKPIADMFFAIRTSLETNGEMLKSLSSSVKLASAGRHESE